MENIIIVNLFATKNITQNKYVYVYVHSSTQSVILMTDRYGISWHSTLVCVCVCVRQKCQKSMLLPNANLHIF